MLPLSSMPETVIAPVSLPGGYRFGDYWRMGLPLDILIVAVAVPLIVTVWPF